MLLNPKTGTDGMDSDIPFDDAAYYVDDMAYAATNMGFDIPQEKQHKTLQWDLMCSVPKESAIVSGKDSQKEKVIHQNTKDRKILQDTEKTENTERVNLQRVKIPFDEDCFYGRNRDGEITKIADIQDEIGEVVIEGMVSSTEEKRD